MKNKKKLSKVSYPDQEKELVVRNEDPAPYGQAIRVERLRKMVTGKSKTLSVRINPDLPTLIDKTLAQTDEFKSRNELIEVLLLRYLESKGKL